MSLVSKMAYNFLGPSGLKVSNLCLGTMLFGPSKAGRPSCTESESHALMDRYVELGGNFIDTADMYQNGVSEEIIGRWLKKQKRESLVLTTKFGRTMDSKNPNCKGGSRKHIMSSIEKSLKRLQTAYIDIYMMHLPDDGCPLEETLSALNDLVRDGRVRYLALSNAKGWQLQKAVEMSRYRNWEKIICIESQYSLLCRSPEWEVLDVCKHEGLGFLPWSPLKGGWLSGKMKREAPPGEDSRVGWASAKSGRAHHSHPSWAFFNESEQAWSTIDKVQEIAARHDRSIPQVALRWLLQKPCVPSVVIGPRTIEHLESNMAAASGWVLSADEMAELDAVSDPHPPYPYDSYLVGPNEDRQRP
ncbi:hypothetical protein CAPTEDRAFT_157900 [Capitella teleta]|uniref:NADP-dependent oxidoreductase domain-containing protein n=1 Tax=Capitella teleta TaxID=283909 RepID=R7V6N9_CAPTE|nr:hypothetical protein CAPTEDRAFT_157900 [Capitella teleta]|eukprot:ELU14122.1 hypothetical protein CAPTEDRAFT_157900 [Capitella teleta]